MPKKHNFVFRTFYLPFCLALVQESGHGTGTATTATGTATGHGTATGTVSTLLDRARCLNIFMYQGHKSQARSMSMIMCRQPTIALTVVGIGAVIGMRRRSCFNISSTANGFKTHIDPPIIRLQSFDVG